MSSPDPVLSASVEPAGDGSPAPPAVVRAEAYRADRERSALMFSVAALWRWKWFILAATVLTAAASVAISLSLPVWYKSTARVLPPESSSGGGLSALIGDLSPVASQILGGGGGGDYTRYRGILTSRTMSELMMERFDLVEVYDTEGKEFPEYEALRKLSDNASFEVDLEMEYLEISVLDQDPQRAAQMANFYVEELNRRNEELALEGASGFRQYVEGRYREIEMSLDSSLTEMQALQERRGIIELPAMAEGLIESLAAQRAQIARVEIEYEALKSELGPENPQVMAAREALATARRSQESLESGRESVMPVALRDLPAVAGEYARIYQDILVQQTLMENARPLLEQARFDEERERTAVQVLDPAVPAVRKAKPKRAFIVLGATLSVALLSALFALLLEGLRGWRASLRDPLGDELAPS